MNTHYELSVCLNEAIFKSYSLYIILCLIVQRFHVVILVKSFVCILL